MWKKNKLYPVHFLKNCRPRNKSYVIDEDSNLDHADNPMIVQNCVLSDLDSQDDFPITTDGLLTSDSAEEPNIRPDLYHEQKVDMDKIIRNFTFFSEKTICTATLKHDTDIKSTERMKSNLYPTLINLQPYFEDEVNKLHKQGIIRQLLTALLSNDNG